MGSVISIFTIRGQGLSLGDSVVSTSHSLERTQCLSFTMCPITSLELVYHGSKFTGSQ